MFIEKRKQGKNLKYYLIHSYRDEKNEVKKIRRFLGSNLNEKDIKRLVPQAEELIKSRLEDMKLEVFDFLLSNKEIKSLNKHNDKIEIIHFDEKFWDRFTEEFIYNTNAIEGSTILLDEVSKILNKNNLKDPEEIETKGVSKAINFIRNTKQPFSLNLILKIHKLCFEGSKDFAGKLRNVEVVIRGRDGKIIHKGTPVAKLEDEMKDFISWYKKNKDKFKPIILAGIIHNQFEDIHPFQDGNGRVGRLLLNFILLKNCYPPINILLEDRAEYYMVLQKYQKDGELLPTIRFLLKQYKKTLKNITTKK